MDRPSDAVAQEISKGTCHCPFCDNTLEMPYPFCQACGAELRICPVCGQPLPQDAQVCPHCAETA